MRKIFDSKYKADVMLIGQGEFYVSNQSELIATTLGSCISICIYDPLSKVGGMNHYMLPEPVLKKDNIEFGRAKYGINSMEMLINEVLKYGGKRDRLKAKMFGGANMFAKTTDPNSDRIGVGEQNIQFGIKYLSLEGITIQSQDVGLDHARKVYFEPGTGKVKLFRLDSQKQNEIKQSEKKYHQKIKETSADEKLRRKEKEDKITFF